MKPSEVLRAARAKIEKPENWTRRANARNLDGHAVSAVSGFAASWDANGACLSVADDWWACPAVNALRNAIAAIEPHSKITSLAGFNDTHTHAEVIALFDRAIAAEEEAGR
jgi:hypothetical protein